MKKILLSLLLVVLLLGVTADHPVQVIVLSLLQGLTEFLPISSSAHLVFVPNLTGWPDQGLAFDCMVHLGTLAAVVGYFWRDLLRMLGGGLICLKERSLGASQEGWLLFLILVATIPVGLAGLALKDIVETTLRSTTVIALASIGFGLLLWLADRQGRRQKTTEDWGLRQAMLVGCAQALALIPGTSRSGATMTAALMLGYTREAAARFSFLLSIPVIILAGGLKMLDWMQQPESYMTAPDLMLGFVLSAVSGYACIHYFLGFIERMGWVPFVAYRIGLGFMLLLL
ncbi:MAG: undecaprenyl-diphosphate phosphatase [Gammaproteobacteria bacterium]|nr:MAG: undecaprenyl-diphosphate phosphatase [Gammaproteobacteria bacterium]